ncbi:hypothetical protein C8Q77DRAFT_1097047 [Trametes polyzona]|nr:hypothetical protein C8Q77DRAFT_1097047 [Trametes polyzona]
MLVNATLKARVAPPMDKSTTKSGTAALQPAAQIEPDSYIGQVFNSLGARHRALEPSEPSESSSSSSSSDSDDLDWAAPRPRDEHSLWRKLKRAKRRERRRKEKAARLAAKLKAPVLKPADPKVYNGAPNVIVYHKFMQDMIEYINGYQLPPERHTSVVGKFLSGRAYDCYATTFAATLHLFSLRDREKLMNTRQGSLTVWEYVQDLRSKMLVVGALTEEAKVELLWGGLDPEIQGELWRARLNPAVSTFAEVQAEAEITERALAASAAARRRLGTRQPGISGCTHGSFGTALRSDMARDTAPHRAGAPDARNPSVGQRMSAGSRSTASLKSQSGSRFRGGRSGGIGGSSSSGRGRSGSSYPKLSEKEHDELMAAGKCFLCREADHVKSDHRDRPPGMTSFNVELGSTRVEDLRPAAHLRLGSGTTRCRMRSPSRACGQYCSPPSRKDRNLSRPAVTGMVQPMRAPAYRAASIQTGWRAFAVRGNSLQSTY